MVPPSQFSFHLFQLNKPGFCLYLYPISVRHQQIILTDYDINKICCKESAPKGALAFGWWFQQCQQVMLLAGLSRQYSIHWKSNVSIAHPLKAFCSLCTKLNGTNWVYSTHSFQYCSYIEYYILYYIDIIILNIIYIIVILNITYSTYIIQYYLSICI